MGLHYSCCHLLLGVPSAKGGKKHGKKQTVNYKYEHGTKEAAEQAMAVDKAKWLQPKSSKGKDLAVQADQPLEKNRTGCARSLAKQQPRDFSRLAAPTPKLGTPAQRTRFKNHLKTPNSQHQTKTNNGSELTMTLSGELKPLFAFGRSKLIK